MLHAFWAHSPLIKVDWFAMTSKKKNMSFTFSNCVHPAMLQNWKRSLQHVHVVNKVALQHRSLPRTPRLRSQATRGFFVLRIDGTVCTFTEWYDTLPIPFTLNGNSFGSRFSINQASIKFRPTFGGSPLHTSWPGTLPQHPLESHPSFLCEQRLVVRPSPMVS